MPEADNSYASEFSAEYAEFEHLPIEQQQEYGPCDKYDDTCYLVIRVDGKVSDVHSDGGEPEDNRFMRDWNWIAEALEEAYQLGRKHEARQIQVDNYDAWCR